MIYFAIFAKIVKRYTAMMTLDLNYFLSYSICVAVEHLASSYMHIFPTLLCKQSKVAVFYYELVDNNNLPYYKFNIQFSVRIFFFSTKGLGSYLSHSEVIILLYIPSAACITNNNKRLCVCVYNPCPFCNLWQIFWYLYLSFEKLLFWTVILVLW
jgi:hypothetical protein